MIHSICDAFAPKAHKFSFELAQYYIVLLTLNLNEILSVVQFQMGTLCSYSFTSFTNFDFSKDLEIFRQFA